MVSCLRQDSRAFQLFNQGRNLDFALPTTRAHFLYQLLNGNIVDPWLRADADFDTTHPAYIDEFLTRSRALGGLQAMNIRRFCRLLPARWSAALVDGMGFLPALKRQFTPSPVRASSRPDFLDNGRQAENLHHSHHYPCDVLFLTSKRFNLAEGRIGKADYEVCRRAVDLWDSQLPQVVAGNNQPVDGGMATLAKSLVAPNLAFMKWTARQVLQKNPTDAELAYVGVTRPVWDAAPLPWVRPAQKPTRAQLDNAVGVAVRNQTTYEGVMDAMRHIWNAPGVPQQQIAPRCVTKQALRASWLVRNAHNGPLDGEPLDLHAAASLRLLSP